MAHLMKITDAAGKMLVRGDWRGSGRLGWIEIYSFNWGPNSRSSFPGDGTNTSQIRNNITSMAFLKERDNASIWLAQAAFGNNSDNNIKITIESSQGNGITITYVMTDAMLTRFSSSASGFGVRAEQYEVSFRRLSMGTASVTSG